MIIYDLICNIIGEYQKIKNLLDDTINQPTKFRTKPLVEISDKSQRAYNDDNDDNGNNDNDNHNNNEIKFLKPQ